MADDVTFFFDPSCPFTWRTSRWLVEVTEPRGHTVDWNLMSLAILNEGKEIPEQYRSRMAAGRRAVRLLFGAKQRYGNEALATLYTELGTRVHYQGAAMDDTTFAIAIEAAGLPADAIEAADDTALDPGVKDSHDAGQARAGQESGSPVTCVGDAPGFFGPIVVPPPEGEAAEKLYDAVRLLSAVAEFSELKRARASF